jgi:ABC-2 type transport system ATP-binding protein
MASVEELCDNIALINKSEKILDGSVKDIKLRYSTNSYEVRYRDFGDTDYHLNEPGFDLLSSTITDGIITATYRLPATKGPNDLLAAILPNVNMVAFNEVIPSMNDIFISTVNSVNANHFLES